MQSDGRVRYWHRVEWRNRNVRNTMGRNWPQQTYASAYRTNCVFIGAKRIHWNAQSYAAQWQCCSVFIFHLNFIIIFNSWFMQCRLSPDVASLWCGIFHLQIHIKSPLNCSGGYQFVYSNFWCRLFTQCFKSDNEVRMFAAYFDMKWMRREAECVFWWHTNPNRSIHT